VSGRGGWPISINWMSLSARNATCRPSGDRTGLPMPSTGFGVVDVKSRGRANSGPSSTVTAAVNGTFVDGPPFSRRRRSAPSAV
jgi:hypothetical protein